MAALAASNMKTHVLAIAVVMDGNKVLLRKKRPGEGPYKEPWYLFGGIVEPGASPEDAVRGVMREQAGIELANIKRLSWDTEVKPDEDGEETFFVYLDNLCEYAGGELKPGKGIYHIEWADVAALSKYELNPPSRVLFKRLQMLQ